MSTSSDRLTENLVNKHPALRNQRGKREQVITSVKEAFSKMELKGKINAKEILSIQDKTR